MTHLVSSRSFEVLGGRGTVVHSPNGAAFWARTSTFVFRNNPRSPVQRVCRVDMLVRRLSSAESAGLRLGWDVNARSSWIFHPRADSSEPRRPRLHIAEAAGSGMGGFAVVDIEAGERILAERPLLEWSVAAFAKHKGRERQAMDTAVCAKLSEAEQRDFLDLCCNEEHGPERHAYGIWLSNAYPTEDEPESAAVFRVASRLNHSCQPNAHAAYDLRTHRMRVHALVPIRAGEEVFVSYLGGDPDVRSARRAELLRDFGFECRCRKCGLVGAALAESEESQARIKQLSARITAHPCPSNVVALVEEKLRLLEREGQLTSWDTMACAMQYLRLTSQPKGARKWARRAAENAKRALGEDSDEYRQLSGAA